MDGKLLTAHVEELEIAELSNAEGMMPAGKNIISRMAFEIHQSRILLDELKGETEEAKEYIENVEYQRDKLILHNKILMESLERLASSEAFHLAGTMNKEESMRIEYAQNALESIGE